MSACLSLTFMSPFFVKFQLLHSLVMTYLKIYINIFYSLAWSRQWLHILFFLFVRIMFFLWLFYTYFLHSLCRWRTSIWNYKLIIFIRTTRRFSHRNRWVYVSRLFSTRRVWIWRHSRWWRFNITDYTNCYFSRCK